LRWRERAAALLPTIACIWVLLLARNTQEQSSYWSNYFAFQASYYPAGDYPLLYVQTQEEHLLALATINQLGWTAIGVTEGMVLIGGALLLRWHSLAAGYRRLWNGAGAERQAANEANTLDITIEPIDMARGDRNSPPQATAF